MWYYILTYVAVWVLFGAGAIGYDYYRYKAHESLDHKFPITSTETQKVIMCLAFFWPLWVVFAMWSGVCCVCNSVKKCLC